MEGPVNSSGIGWMVGSSNVCGGGWMAKWVDGWMDTWMDGWMDGQMDGWMDR